MTAVRSLFLVGKRPCPQPVVESWLAAVKSGNVVLFGKRFGR
jgi:hypothetical protein